jgi:hypothetical protein
MLSRCPAPMRPASRQPEAWRRPPHGRKFALFPRILGTSPFSTGPGVVKSPERGDLPRRLRFHRFSTVSTARWGVSAEPSHAWIAAVPRA